MKIDTRSILLSVFGLLLVILAGMYYFAMRSPQTLTLSPLELQWIEEHDRKIRIAPLPDAPPIDFVDQAGNHLGLTSDYLKLIEKQLNIQFIQVECESWKEIIEKLETHEIDLVGSVQNTKERRNFLRFTKPYLRIPNVILMRKEVSGHFNIDSLKGLRIAIVNGSATHAHLAALHPEYTFVPVIDAATGFRLLSFHDVDAMVVDLGVASYYIEALGISNLRVAGDIDYPWELCFAARKDWPLLSSILDKALANINSSQRRSIRRKWITLSDTIIIPRQRYLQIISLILFGTLFAVSSVILWNRTLRQQVMRRTRELGRVQQSHQKAARALNESEERFRALVESSADIIWEINPAGEYTYASPQARDILGIDPALLMGQSARSTSITAEAAQKKTRRPHYTQDSIIDCEVETHRHTSGRKVILETSGRAFLDNTGQLAGFRGVSRDITARTEAERALKQSEERFRNLVETTSDWIWEVDTKGRYTYASPQIGDLLGYTPADLIGKPFTETMPQSEADSMASFFEEIAQTGAPIHSLVNLNQHRNGHSVVLETSAVPFYDKDWNIQGYRGIARDITARTASEKQLEFERSLFRSFMEHAPDLIYFKDSEGRFIEINQAKASELNLPPEEILGKTDFDFFPAEEAQKRFDDELNVMRSETPIQVEEMATTPAGSRWYLTTKVPRYDEEGQVVGTFGTSWDITARKKNAEEIRRLRAQLSNIIDSMPSVLVGVDLKGNVTQWNREAEHITHIEAARAMGKPLPKVFPQLAKEMEKVDRAIRERTPQKEERIPVRENHRTRYTDVTVYPLLDNDASGAVIRIDDVTDRVLIEDSIRNIVEGVSSVGRRFFDSMVSQLAKTLDADCTFISEFSNETAKTMQTIAVSARGQVGRNFTYPLLSTPCQQVMEGESCIFIADVCEQYPDAELLHTFKAKGYIGIPLIDSEEQIRGCMVALYKDPIERQEFAMSIMQVFAGRTAAELERLQATKELLGLRNFLSSIVNSMPSILVGVDAEARVMQWNHEAERITGVSAEHAQGQPLIAVFPSLGTEMDRILQAIEKGQLHHDEHLSCMIKNEQHFVDVTVYPLSTDEADGAVIRVDDVTDRVRIEEMMVQSEKMMSVGGLAAGMAHEINNPLAGILQNLQVMRNRITHDTERNQAAAQEAGTSLNAIQTYMNDRGLIQMMDSVTEAGRRAAKIVDNMLSFSRKAEAHFAPHNLQDILEQSLELATNDYNLKKRFDFRHIRIDRDYDETLPLLSCESSQIQQVILNLISNSAQAMAERPDTEHEPRITLRLKKEKTMALIEVEDNGPGMDSDTRRRVFEPFFTTKEVGHGTGLGLSVSYFIITENHGGTMQVDSSPGKGTCFSIRIPYRPQKTPAGLRM